MQRKKKSPSVIQMFSTVLIVLVALFYLVMALGTKDVIWFWPEFDGQPYEILLNCYGEQQTFKRQDAHFQPLNEGFNLILSGSKRWDTLYMSDESYDYYQTSDAVVVLEYHYSPPTRIHSMVQYYKNMDTLLIPLDGRHSISSPVFGRTNGISNSGSFHLETSQPLIDYLSAQGLCEIKP
jgi:hypothetical protein